MKWYAARSMFALGVLLGIMLPAAGQDGPKWEAMDYGPFLSAAIEVDPGNIAYKGIAVSLGQTPEGEATMLFDTDLLRWAAGWRGGGVALRGIVYDGPHGIHPRIDGTPDWVTPALPGVSVDGDFVDLRPWPYGPLDSTQPRWNGLQVVDNQVAMSYRVGSTNILETPGLFVEDGLTVYTRSIDVEGTDRDLLVELLRASGAVTRSLESVGVTLGVNLAARRFGVVIVRENQPEWAIGVVQSHSGTAMVVQDGADVRLRLNPFFQKGTESILVLMAPIQDRDDLVTFGKVLSKQGSPVNLDRFSKPMAAGWIPSVTTQGELDFNPFTREDSTQIRVGAGAQPLDMPLDPWINGVMSISGFDGVLRTQPDVPVSEAYALSTSSGGSLSVKPTGSWTFDEGEGDTMRNESTGRRDLELDGVTWRRGIKGRSLDFDGTARATWTRGTSMAFTRSNLTFAAWIATRSDGTIMSKTLPEGPWVPNGVTFFVRDGRVAFDVGWVGVVHGSTEIADGGWHHVAFTWSHVDGQVRIFVDGQEDASGSLPLAAPVKDAVVQLGFTAENFPNPSWFSGYMEGVRVYTHVLDADQLAQVASETGSPLVQVWLTRGDLPGATWRRLGGGRVVLHLPTDSSPRAGELLTMRCPETNLQEAVHRLRNMGSPSQSAFETDHLVRPLENPWNAWMRFGALDFLPGGDTAVITTWSGDVWMVEDLDEDLDELTWTRIASGLSQPLGVTVKDGDIYVLGRDQVTRLVDLDGDWVTDHYENFNNDTMNSEHFHEPASGLHTDANGNFYYLKAARHAKDAVHPHHGTLVKISADGTRSEVIASGFRAPNGLAVELGDVFYCSDQEGHWMPANRINRIEPGGFYGNKWTGDAARERDTYDPPLTWIHPTIDRSPSSQIRVTNPLWGDLNGRLLGLSYGTGRVYLLLEDEVDGVHQGGVVPLPIRVPTGLMSGRFNPADGHLYLCGLVGWSSDSTEDGGFYRVRSTGPLPPLPDEVRAVKDGLVLHFTQPLDSAATDPSRWDVDAWNYQWSERYGSPEFKLDGGPGRTPMPVHRVLLSPDQRTAWLSIPSMSPAMQVHVDYLVPVGGQDHEGYAHLTVHQLHDQSGRSLVTQ